MAADALNCWQIDPRLNKPLLDGIASSTSGLYIAPAQVDELPDKIPTKTEELVVAGAPIPLWDRWQILALVCFFLGLEWAVRKRSKMV